MEREDIEKLYEVLKDTNIIVLSDEIYAELTFSGKPHVSPASVEGMRERTVTRLCLRSKRDFKADY